MCVCVCVCVSIEYYTIVVAFYQYFFKFKNIVARWWRIFLYEIGIMLFLSILLMTSNEILKTFKKWFSKFYQLTFIIWIQNRNRFRKWNV